ncbi:hypothetical protein GKZ68_16955 [Hymenobacter sp. BRD128]|uniref:hypothetical protein n=1 Tax=Hymenobacter sp. BRD128 TaxID=2675878 RepID=UPI001565D0B5|nr:hypothetical protein [Hymenobacter sp. BRD128]QKG58167.1 hypothetical protein GKZ68_16955 [Hymenobacter sp. BRD128]
MLEERKSLLGNMATHGEGHWSQQKTGRVEDMKRHLNCLREFLLNGSEGMAPTEPGPG